MIGGFFEGFINPELIVCCGASSLPEDWSEEWNNMDLQVTWGVTREQYNSQYA